MKKNKIDKENSEVQNENVNDKHLKVTKMGRRKLILIISGIILLLLVGIRIFQTFAPATVDEVQAVNVKADTVKSLSFSASSPITGRIEPIEEVSITSLAGGEVISVNVKLGDYVEKGTILFETDKTQIAANYNQAKASYLLAKKSYENMSLLLNEGAVSMYDYDQSKVQYESALAGYTSASESYNNTNPSSPIDGFVTSLNLSVGNTLSPGTPVASVANVSSLVIKTSVSEYLVGNLSINDTVEIYISTIGDEIFQGTVTALAPAPAKGTLTYPLEISVIDPTGTVKAGMFAEIRITSDERDKVIAVPSDSVIVKNGESMVVVLNNQIPKYRKIKTGLDNGTYAEVTEGLKEGEMIVIEGQQFITENVKVNVTNK